MAVEILFCFHGDLLLLIELVSQASEQMPLHPSLYLSQLDDCTWSQLFYLVTHSLRDSIYTNFIIYIIFYWSTFSYLTYSVLSIEEF